MALWLREGRSSNQENRQMGLEYVQMRGMYAGTSGATINRPPPSAPIADSSGVMRMRLTPW